MNRLVVERGEHGGWTVTVDGQAIGEIRSDPDGLGYESRRMPLPAWEWSDSFDRALAWVIRDVQPQ